MLHNLYLESTQIHLLKYPLWPSLPIPTALKKKKKPINHWDTSTQSQPASPKARKLSSFDGFIIPFNRLWKLLASWDNNSKALTSRFIVCTGELGEYADKWPVYIPQSLPFTPTSRAPPSDRAGALQQTVLIFTQPSFHALRISCTTRQLQAHANFVLGQSFALHWKTLCLLCFAMDNCPLKWLRAGYDRAQWQNACLTSTRS